jgi:hypothetical protein
MDQGSEEIRLLAAGHRHKLSKRGIHAYWRLLPLPIISGFGADLAATQPDPPDATRPMPPHPTSGGTLPLAAAYSPFHGKEPAIRLGARQETTRRQLPEGRLAKVANRKLAYHHMHRTHTGTCLVNDSSRSPRTKQIVDEILKV